MDIGSISTRYAKALLSYAKDEKTESLVYLEMICLSKSFFEFEDLKKILNNPIVSKESKIKLLISASGIEVSDTTKKFIRFVLDKKKEQYIHFMAMSYQNIFQEDKKIVVAEVVSAIEMDVQSIDKILKVIESNYPGKSIELDLKENADLIGGFVLNVGTSRLDASVAGAFRNLKKELNLY